MAVELVAGAFYVAGVFFFFAGSVGLLRFPDTTSRLHALTKADNVGLGFVATGAAFTAGTPAAAVKLLAIWLLVMITNSLVCCLIAGRLAATAERSSE